MVLVKPTTVVQLEVLSALFRRLFLEMLLAAHDDGRLQFFGDHGRLADKTAFNAYLRPLRERLWSKAMVVSVAETPRRISAGTIERGERKRTASEASKAD